MSKLFAAVILSIFLIAAAQDADTQDADTQNSTAQDTSQDETTQNEPSQEIAAQDEDDQTSANTFVGDWLRQDIEDPFVDDEQFALVIGTSGERYTGQGGFFGVICKAGVTDVVYFKLDGALPNNERRPFDYRVNGGEITTSEGWMSANLVSLHSGEDDFDAFKTATLQDNANVAVTTDSSRGERLVAEFELVGLDSTLEAVACQK